MTAWTVAIGPSSFAQSDPAPLEQLRAAGVTVIPNPYGRRLNEVETVQLLGDVDGLIAGLEPLHASVLDRAPRLRVIARVGIGMDNVDVKAASARGIHVSNTPEQPADAVAEMTLGALISLCREMPATNAALHRGEWLKVTGRSLKGLTLLIVGFGRIGRRVANLLAPFGTHVLVADPYADPVDFPAGIHSVSLEAGLGAADAISLHASGRDMILDATAFSRVRNGVLILNSARGELVDEEALCAALDAGTVGGAWFDAFWQEPYEGRLKHYDRVLLTPHIGTYTVTCRREMELAAVQNLLRDLEATRS